MKFSKIMTLAALAMGLMLAGPQRAQAAVLTVDCTSPSLDINPPAAGQLPDSICGTLSPLPGDAVVQSITLLVRYSPSLELGGVVGTADFGHTVNGVGTTAFDNGGATTPTTAAHPLLDFTIPLVCAGGNCDSTLAALLAGSVTVSTWVDTPTGATSGVSSDFAWNVTYDVRQVPEPTSMILMGLGLLGAGIARRRLQ